MPIPIRDHRIPVATAKAMTQRYRNSVPKGSFLAGLFGSEAFQALLAQPGCAGIRVYLGRHEDGAINMVLVGTDAEGRDLVPGNPGLGENDGGETMQDGYPCPIYCDDSSPLAVD